MNIPDTGDKYLLEGCEMTGEYFVELERRAGLFEEDIPTNIGTAMSGCLREESWHISFIHKPDYSFVAAWSRFTNQRYYMILDEQTEVVSMHDVDDATLELALRDLHEETQWIDNIKQPNLDEHITEEISRYRSGL